MTPNQNKEEISKAYVAALAAKCGLKLGHWSQDSGGVDLTLGAGSPVGAGTLARPKLDVQLKCTSDASKEKADHVSWQLTRDRYNILCQDSSTPIILVLVMLPEREEEWIEHSADALILRKCAWWVWLQGQRMLEEHEASIHIKIPKKQIFSPSALSQFMHNISCGLPLNHQEGSAP